MGMNNVYTSLQRWIYAKGSTVQFALRNLAKAIDEFDISEEDVEHKEYYHPAFVEGDCQGSVVEILYMAEEEMPFRAGICMSWRPAHD